MPLSTKLKVALSLGTAITATAVTAYLIISSNNDLEKNKLSDEALENLELTTKPFEEETIKAQEESDEKEVDTEEKDSSKDKSSEDKGPEEKKKPEAEPKDPKQALLDAEKDIKALANAGGGADKLEITIPEAAQIGQETQKAPIENKPSLEEGQPQSIPEDEKSAQEGVGDNLEMPPASPPKKTAPEASGATPEPSVGKPVSEDDLEDAEELGLEDRQDLQQEPTLREEQTLDERSDIDGVPEEPESGLAETSENEDGGAQMTEEEIEELVALQGKMAEFSDRLSDLLQLRRFK